MRPMEEGEETNLEVDYWAAVKGGWKLDIRWLPSTCRYHCRVFHNGTLEGDAQFDYPHEVVEWLGKHFTALQEE